MRTMLLPEMVSMLRAEARISQNVAHGVHLDAPHKSLLRRIHEELYDAAEWPHLRMNWTKELTTGTRYGQYPEGLSLGGINHVYLKDGATLRPLRYGIGIEEYNSIDSEEGAQSYPVRNWVSYLSPAAEEVSVDMFEVWPIPDQTVNLVFAGKRDLFPLLVDEDKSTLDGPLIVLHAAAEILAGQRSEDAQLKLQKAQARLDMLKKRQVSGDHRPLNFSSPQRGPRLRPGIDYIPE